MDPRIEFSVKGSFCDSGDDTIIANGCESVSETVFWGKVNENERKRFLAKLRVMTRFGGFSAFKQLDLIFRWHVGGKGAVLMKQRQINEKEKTGALL